MSSVSVSAGSQTRRLMEQIANDRVERARLQAQINRVGQIQRIREGLLQPVTPAVSSLLNIRA
jgi:hypothetical protein